MTSDPNRKGPSRLLILLAISLNLWVGATSAEEKSVVPAAGAKEKTPLDKSLDTPMRSPFSFSKVGVQDAISFVRARAKAQKVPLNIVIKGEVSDTRFGTRIENLTFREAITEIGALGGLVPTFEKHAVVMIPLEDAKAAAAGNAKEAAPEALPDAPPFFEVIIPEIIVQRVSPVDAAAFVSLRANKIAPEKNLPIRVEGKKDAKISLTLSEIPVGEVLRYIAELSQLEVVVEADAIVLRPPAMKK